jgi:GT2 family glycosyltransferase
MTEHLLDLSILIVTHNSDAWLAPCLASIRAETRCAYEVIVVDNASTDAALPKASSQGPVTAVIGNQENVGFAVANNQGARLASGRYLLLLNPDSLVLGDALDVLVAFMDAHPEVGICAPRNLDGAGALKRNGGRISTPLGYIYGALTAPFQPGLQQLLRRIRRSRACDLTGDAPLDVQVVHGNSLCIRRDIYRALNGLDESFFMYIEDVDLCLRVQQEGWRIVYLPTAQVIHYGGHSAAKQMQPTLNGMIVSHVVSSRYHYVAKNYGRVWQWLLRTACYLSGICWIGMGLFTGSPRQRAEKRAIGCALLMTRPPDSRQALHARDILQPGYEFSK